MPPQPDYLSIKFGVDVWHDEPYDGKPADFFDREQEKRQALDILKSEEGTRIVWLVGERRAGKTSMLHLLLEKCRQQGMKAFEVPWTVIHSPVDFYREYLGALSKVLELSDLHRTPHNMQNVSDFWKALDEFRSNLPQIVVGLDEIDSILFGMQREERDVFVGILRYLVEGLGQKLILTSVQRVENLEELKSSPLASISRTIDLFPFQNQDLKDMIECLAATEKNAWPQIAEHSGNWPYYAKAILYHLLQIPRDTSGRLEKAIQAAVKEIAPTCEHLYRHHWDDNERRVLLLLARQGALSSKEIDALGAEGIIKRMVNRGYLFEDKETYRFRVRLIERWFQEWYRREVEEEKLNLALWMQVIALLNKEKGEREIRVTRDELDQAEF